MAEVLTPPNVFGTDFSRCRPLVLDPWLTDRRLMRDSLKALGCGQVIDCARTEQGIAAIMAGECNVLFLDWSEKIDALSFLQGLRAPSNPHRFLPVVVTTSYSGMNHINAARDFGANEFMLRPWSQHILASRLRSLIERPRLFIQGGGFFGPDRRRRRIDLNGSDRRRHENYTGADRRTQQRNWSGPERRQGRDGFVPLERRDAPRV